MNRLYFGKETDPSYLKGLLICHTFKSNTKKALSLKEASSASETLKKMAAQCPCKAAKLIEEQFDSNAYIAAELLLDDTLNCAPKAKNERKPKEHTLESIFFEIFNKNEQTTYENPAEVIIKEFFERNPKKAALLCTYVIQTHISNLLNNKKVNPGTYDIFIKDDVLEINGQQFKNLDKIKPFLNYLMLYVKDFTPKIFDIQIPQHLSDFKIKIEKLETGLDIKLLY